MANLNAKIPHVLVFEVRWIKQELVLARSPQGDAAISGNIPCVGPMNFAFTIIELRSTHMIKDTTIS